MTVSEVPERNGNLASRLRTMAQGRDTLDVARFQFIDLEEIRGAYADRWPEHKARIKGIAEGFLRRRIDASDLLISAGDGFLVVFGSAAGAGAAAAAAASTLSHGLNEFFLGEICEVPAPRFGATNLSVGLQELTETLGGVDFVAPQVPPKIEALGLPTVDWRYQPVWDVRRETLSNWYVTPYSKKTLERLPGYQFENVSVSAAQFAAIDEASLLVSEQTLQELIPQGRQVMIGVSLHASTLTIVSLRARLLAALDGLDPEFFRYRVLKIAGVAPGFPRLYLNEIVSLLRARIGNVVIGAAWEEPDMASLLQSGPVAVGVTLSRSVLGSTAPVPVETLLRKLAADIHSVHAAHKRFFVEGQIERELAARLAVSGVDNISSPRIWPAGGIPDGMLKWPLSRLAA